MRKLSQEIFFFSGTREEAISYHSKEELEKLNYFQFLAQKKASETQ